MKAEDVTNTLKLALAVSGCDKANIVHKPRLLSDNGSSYISGDLAERSENGSRPGGTIPSANPGQDRTLASNAEEPDLAGELLSTW